jgi:hypothetical protein
MIYCICGHAAYKHTTGYFTGTAICDGCYNFSDFHHEFKQDNLKYLEWCAEKRS